MGKGRKGLVPNDLFGVGGLGALGVGLGLISSGPGSVKPTYSSVLLYADSGVHGVYGAIFMLFTSDSTPWARGP